MTRKSTAGTREASRLLRGAAARDESPHKRARIAAAVWGVFLFAMTSWPSPPDIPVVSAIPALDKLTHLLLYAVEAFLLYRAIAWPGRVAFAPARILAVCGAMAVWGTLDEVHQEWIPGREMEAGDLGSDIAGAFVGATFASLARPGRRRLPEQKAS